MMIGHHNHYNGDPASFNGHHGYSGRSNSTTARGGRGFGWRGRGGTARSRCGSGYAGRSGPSNPSYRNPIPASAITYSIPPSTAPTTTPRAPAFNTSPRRIPVPSPSLEIRPEQHTNARRHSMPEPTSQLTSTMDNIEPRTNARSTTRREIERKPVARSNSASTSNNSRREQSGTQVTNNYTDARRNSRRISVQSIEEEAPVPEVFTFHDNDVVHEPEDINPEEVQEEPFKNWGPPPPYIAPEPSPEPEPELELEYAPPTRSVDLSNEGGGHSNEMSVPTILIIAPEEDDDGLDPFEDQEDYEELPELEVSSNAPPSRLPPPPPPPPSSPLSSVMQDEGYGTLTETMRHSLALELSSSLPPPPPLPPRSPPKESIPIPDQDEGYATLPSTNGWQDFAISALRHPEPEPEPETSIRLLTNPDFHAGTLALLPTAPSRAPPAATPIQPESTQLESIEPVHSFRALIEPNQPKLAEPEHTKIDIDPRGPWPWFPTAHLQIPYTVNGDVLPPKVPPKIPLDRPPEEGWLIPVLSIVEPDGDLAREAREGMVIEGEPRGEGEDERRGEGRGEGNGNRIESGNKCCVRKLRKKVLSRLVV